MLSLNKKSYVPSCGAGMTTVEVAGISFVLAFVGYLIFSVAELVGMRHDVNDLVQAAMAVHESPVIDLGVNTAGEVRYQLNHDKAQQLMSTVLAVAKTPTVQASLLSHDPYRIEILLQVVAINTATGAYEGMTADRLATSTGDYSPSSAVLANYSVATELQNVQSNRSLQESLAEPSTNISQPSSAYNYIPMSAILVLCIYVKDGRAVDPIFKTPLVPDGAVAQCQVKKVRGFL